MKNFKTPLGLALLIGFGATLFLSSNIKALTLSSTSFGYGANIPTAHACSGYGGTNSNPQLSLRDVPTSTKAFALIMEDADAAGGAYVHWLLYWNSPNITVINAGSIPVGGVQGVNDNSAIAYSGPCQSANHRYFIRVYALDTILGLGEGFTRSQLESAMTGHILEINYWMGWFADGGISCTYTLSPQEYDFSSYAANGTINVTCSSNNCSWLAVSNNSWISITSATNATGNGTVAFSVAANYVAPRAGTISIAGQTFRVTQEGFQAALLVTPTNRDVTKDAGTTTFNIYNIGTAMMYWGAHMVSGSDWLSIEVWGQGIVNCTYTANESTSARIATIRVTAPAALNAPKDVTVTQAAGQAIQSILDVTPNSRNVGNTSGTTEFSVSNTGTGTMTWVASVTSGSSWLRITSGTNGTNSGSITCSYDANNTSSARTGTISVMAPGATGTPKDVKITQEGQTIPNSLWLNGNRFQAWAQWRNYNDGSSGQGIGVSLTDETGYFWFFSPGNVELVIKVLDGRELNGCFWVIYGALSDVEYWITIRDSVTGQLRQYYNPPHILGGRADILAFPSGPN